MFFSSSFYYRILPPSLHLGKHNLPMVWTKEGSKVRCAIYLSWSLTRNLVWNPLKHLLHFNSESANNSEIVASGLEMENVCSYFKKESWGEEREREEVRLLHFSFWILSTYHQTSCSTWLAGSCLINVHVQRPSAPGWALSPRAPRWVSTFLCGCWEVPFCFPLPP